MLLQKIVVCGIVTLWARVYILDAVAWDRVVNTAARLVNIKPATEIIRGNGYPAEQHDVLTPDGYLLRVDRIPRPGRSAVFIPNALLCNSACYCMLGRESIAFKIFDAGYDVWLGNFRGHGVSLNHTRLTKYDRAFWSFSLQEHGELDLPAMIDYILADTGQTSILYAGHSLASVIFFIGASLRPDLNKRIQAAFLMGPVATLSYHTNPMVRVEYAFKDWFREEDQRSGGGVAVGTKFLLRYIAALLCAPYLGNNKIGVDCPAFQRTGDLQGKGHVIFPREYWHYAPSYVSFRELAHSLQAADHKPPKFRMYDHGPKRNRLLYGQNTPPDYNLSKITVPNYFYLGNTDTYVRPEDFQFLKSSVPVVRKIYHIPLKEFGHLDFVLNPAAPKYAYRVFIEDMLEVRRP